MVVCSCLFACVVAYLRVLSFVFICCLYVVGVVYLYVCVAHLCDRVWCSNSVTVGVFEAALTKMFCVSRN